MTTPDEDVSKFTGFKRYFNTMTLNGRFNVSRYLYEFYFFMC